MRRNHFITTRIITTAVMGSSVAVNLQDWSEWLVSYSGPYDKERSHSSNRCSFTYPTTSFDLMAKRIEC
jgi:hypothetical protein